MKRFDTPPYGRPVEEGGRISYLWENWFKKITSRLGSGLLPQGVTVGASPFTLQNTTEWDQSIIVQGGTVSKIEYSRDNATYYDTGVTAGMFWVSPTDYLKVTYTVAPTMTAITR